MDGWRELKMTVYTHEEFMEKIEAEKKPIKKVKTSKVKKGAKK